MNTEDSKTISISMEEIDRRIEERVNAWMSKQKDSLLLQLISMIDNERSEAEKSL